MNKLIVIGYRGMKHCFLNMSREEAIALYIDIEGEIDGDISITEFEFDRWFSAYDAYSGEPDKTGKLE